MLQYPVALEGVDFRLPLIVDAINSRVSRSPCDFVKIMHEETAGLSGIARDDVAILLRPFGGTDSGIVIENQRRHRVFENERMLPDSGSRF